MKNLKYIIVFSFFCLSFSVYGQTAQDYFNRAANEYIYQNEQVALNTIDTGLKSYPSDEPLLNLKDKILKDKQQEQQEQQQNQDQQNKEQQNKEQKDQQKQDQQEQNQDQEQQQEQGQDEQQEQNQDQQQSEEGENAEQKEQSQQAEPQESEEEGEEMQQPPQSRAEKLEELNLTEEKARMILEAMKNNEIQYIQQNRRKATKKPDSNKPDW